MRSVGRLLATGTVVLACSQLTGCTVPIGAVTGLFVATDGSPGIVVAVCTGHIDGAVLFEDDADPETLAIAEWDHDGGVTDFATWPLAGDTDWKIDRPFPALDPTRRYSLYAATQDDTNSGTYVTFNAADLTTLQPGQVRYELAGTPQTTSEADFRSHACDSCRPRPT